jgi:hypothetical protein
MLLVTNHSKHHLLVEIIRNKVIQSDLIHEKLQNNEHQQGMSTCFYPRILAYKYSLKYKIMGQLFYKQNIQSKTKSLIPNFENLIKFMMQTRINNRLIK